MMTAFLAMMAAQVAPAIEPDDPSECKAQTGWEALEGRSQTLMFIRQNQEDFDGGDDVAIGFFNDDWSIKETDKLGVIKITASDGSWLSNEATAAEAGFILWTTHEHLSNILSASAMTITKQGKKIDGLKIEGPLRSEWMTFEVCRSKKVAVRAERQRLEKLKKAIPKDPFAK